MLESTERPIRLEELPRLLRSLLLPLAVGGIGSVASADSLRTWYPTLKKPEFTPPNWLFGPAWSTLYLLMGFASFLVSRRSLPSDVRRRVQWAYGAQLGMNALWSFLFFGRRSPLAALVEIVFLWIAIVLTIATFARVSRVAAALLIPYLFWVSFAAVLNAAIWRLND